MKFHDFLLKNLNFVNTATDLILDTYMKLDVMKCPYMDQNIPIIDHRSVF